MASLPPRPPSRNSTEKAAIERARMAATLPPRPPRSAMEHAAIDRALQLADPEYASATQPGEIHDHVDHHAAHASMPGRTCHVCNAATGKYKCPRCEQDFFFCSVACSREHAGDHPDPAPPAQVAREPTPPPPVLSRTGYEEAIDSPEMDAWFAKYPFVHGDLWRLCDVAYDQSVDVDTAWRNARLQLRRLRNEPSERGAALTEFRELVSHLLADKWEFLAAEIVQERARERAMRSGV